MKSTFAMLSALVLAMGATATKAESLAVKVGVFQQEVSSSYHVQHGLPDNDVFAVAVDARGAVFAGTTKGLARFDSGRWTVVEGVPAEPIRRLAASRDGLYAATDAALYRLDAGKARKAADLPHPPTALAVAPVGLLLGTETGLFRERDGRFEPEQDLNRLLGDEPPIRAIAVGSGGEVFVAAKAGLYRGKNGDWKRVLPSAGDANWAVRDVRGVASDRRGRLWFSSPQGVGCLDKNGKWTLFDGRAGLPYNDFTTATSGEDGVVWFGTKIGAIRYDGHHWAYREGRRWLPDNEVRDVAVTAQGDAWFATPKGVGHIERRPMTLAEKARFYEDEIDKYHRRTPYGYVMSVGLDKPGDKTVWHNRDDDNDGQRTGEYGAAECFRYAATKDPEAKRRAKAAFEALRFLSKVTEGSTPAVPKGFPARTVLPVDGQRNPNQEASYSIEADQERRDKEDALWKVIHPRWPTSADGKWYWKCDTSSDELDGHYFLYARYYDLVAETEEEKERVREVVRAITDHLVEHDYQLVDHDGKPTRWARFSPRELNGEPWWWTQRGLNSLSILAYLRVAEHVTGDQKYRAAADELAQKHTYAMNTMYPKFQNGPGSFVQYDDDMAFMGYYSLVRYEKDPKLGELFALSCHEYWRVEACEANSFYNFAFAAICQGKTAGSPWGTQDLSPDRQCIEKAVATLKRYPMDLVSWKQTTSHRIDILPLSRLVRDPGDAEGKGYRTNGEVLPVDERYIEYFSDDAWHLDSGGDGRDLATGTPFLLAYYMGLYHGFIVD
jgi:hypothetical protein